jgi:L-amino acid N-acyltransferase YncA
MMQVRDAHADDAAALARIYNHYVLNTPITFEESAVTAEDMAGRVGEAQAASLPWLVAESADGVLGYAYASKWKGRCAYRFSAEVTVYVEEGGARRGVGSTLYGELLQRLRDAGLHAAMGGIALPNEASVALHEKFGFRQVAQFREVGFKQNRWIDVGYWQVLL